MALETKPAQDPATETKHELDPKRKAALDTALAQVEKASARARPCVSAISPCKMSK